MGMAPAMTAPDRMSPIQQHVWHDHKRSEIRRVITERAYEVYSHLYGTNQSLDRLDERAGFGVGELVAFLYARSFPKAEWSDRVDEAMKGMVLK